MEPRPPEAGDASPAERDGRSGWSTRFGGLFYLLSLANELGLGELLWKACLPEGLVLAHAAASIVGPEADGDPAPVLVGGLPPGGPLPPMPAVSPGQQEEVAAGLLAAAAAALPRRGLATLPEVTLYHADSPAGRLLVAAAPPGDGVLFARPAPSARASADAAAAFLAAWPASGPAPRAAPGFVAPDSTHRLRPAAPPKTPPAPLLPPADTAAAAALLAQVCGTLCHLFAARAGGPRASTAETARRYLALPARVEIDADQVSVRLAMDRIDLSLRRAALDRDPGWVPWLGRTVRVVFESPDQGEPL